MEGQSLLLKVFLPHRYIQSNWFWRCTQSQDGSLRSGAILGVPTIVFNGRWKAYSKLSLIGSVFDSWDHHSTVCKLSWDDTDECSTCIL